MVPPVQPRMSNLRLSSRLSKSSTTLHDSSPFSPNKSHCKYSISSPRVRPASSHSSLETIQDLDVPLDQLLSCNDLTALPFLYDSTVLSCVSERYKNNLIYTWAGPTLVALNPCRSFDHCYTTSLIDQHHHQIQTGGDNHDPHVYSVAGVAHHRLVAAIGLVNQAILVSGESGAGKTESARHLLCYLTRIETAYNDGLRSPMRGVWSNSQPHHVQGRILSSNPILEAFGNAATLRNHNSSRFGKLTRLQYGGNQLRGAEIETYLLEKTRVTHQPDQERNFHIFYQLLHGINSGKIKSLPLNKNEVFDIAPGDTNCYDNSSFNDCLKALYKIGFNEHHQKQIFQVLGAILHLGNVKFCRQDKNKDIWTVDMTGASGRGLNIGCDLLGINSSDLVNALAVRTFSVDVAKKKNTFHKPCERMSDCRERRDALLQLLYQRLFIHLVSFINTQTSAKRNIWSHYLGILDVYGFESFDYNSLEQLCINYTNERLQQEFANRYLATEQRVLLEEGFIGVDVLYTDNSRCVHAIDSSMSVFALLNEECQLRRSVDEEAACERITNALSDTGVVWPPISPRHDGGFVICHYAGPVMYQAKGLLHKNKDEIPQEIINLLKSSKVEFITNMVTGVTIDAHLPDGRKGARKVTTLAKFKTSLDNLMADLSLCDLHYVRCIKPNELSKPGRPDPEYLLNQLKAGGVIETVCLSQAGFPVRMTYGDFVRRYSYQKDVDDIKVETHIIATDVLGDGDGEVPPEKCRFGKNRVFLTESSLKALEQLRDELRNGAATCLQKYIKGSSIRKKFLQKRNAVFTIQRGIRSWLIRHSYKIKRKSAISIQKYYRRWKCLVQFRKIKYSTVEIQRYTRGWLARKRFESLLEESHQRSISRHSITSYGSLGYFSLTASNSAYSLGPSFTDMSPDSPNASFENYGISEDLVKQYLSPENRSRILETEESGIETDTESLSGEAVNKTASKKSKSKRQEAQLKYLLRNKSRFAEIPDNTSCNSENDASEHGNETDCGRTDNNSKILKGNNLFPTLPKMYEPDKIHCTSNVDNLRVATIFKFKDITSVVVGVSPKENLVMVLPSHNVSLYFKNGVLSYRRMPLVKIKFHTRKTCLPFSHHLPHWECPQGLLDAIR